MARFEKGQSGNPRGRPKGSKSKFSKYKRQVAAAMPKILDSLIEQAINGDVPAARALLARTWPEQAAEIESMEQLIDVLTARIEDMQLRRAA